MGIEASGNTYWFERLLVKLGHRLWMGDAAAIRRQDGRKQKHDRRDARLILKLMLDDGFPKIWVPTVAERDLRQLLMHRHQLVRMRARVKNQLQHIALNQGLQKKRQAVDQGGDEVAAGAGAGTLDAAAARHVAGDAGRVGAEDPASGAGGAASSRSPAGSATAGDASRRWPGDRPGDGTDHGRGAIGFENSRSWVSYLGLNPSERSSGEKRRLGGISKQGSPFLRFLLVQGAASAARGDKNLARVYARLKAKKHHGVAKVAVARKLAVRLYWMARTQKPYPEVVRMQGSQSHPVAEVMAVRLSRPPASRQ